MTHTGLPDHKFPSIIRLHLLIMFNNYPPFIPTSLSCLFSPQLAQFALIFFFFSLSFVHFVPESHFSVPNHQPLSAPGNYGTAPVCPCLRYTRVCVELLCELHSTFISCLCTLFVHNHSLLPSAQLDQ